MIVDEKSTPEQFRVAEFTPQTTAVLCPMKDGPVWETAYALRELERVGFAPDLIYDRLAGSAIDLVRCEFAAWALATRATQFLWLDSDIGFRAKHALTLLRHRLPWVCAAYTSKGRGAGFSAHLDRYEKTITFGEGGGLAKIEFAGTGFMLTHRSMYEAIAKACQLPRVRSSSGAEFYPWFLPIAGDGGYLTEDKAFCHRAYQAGFELFCDTSIRLHHVGRYRYTWEDTLPAEPPKRTVQFVFPEDTASKSNAGAQSSANE